MQKIQKGAARTIARNIAIIYFTENSLKIIFKKIHRKRGGRGPLGQPSNPTMNTVCIQIIPAVNIIDKFSAKSGPGL